MNIVKKKVREAIKTNLLVLLECEENSNIRSWYLDFLENVLK